ncbi:MAG: nicotinate-nicotinamide nucleotide adenylyltransferase, partial [Chlamydiae bacterium]|nr:nicotinate-nicotinamide nucleotide adenylyltransferase [Chlamydiota bacterium]
MMHKTIGFFGGTFDPIHLGHLNLAIQLSEIHHLHEVLFCPAYCSPFKKENQPHVNGEHRLRMCQLALEDIPRFRVISYEVERADPSYTIDTLRALKQEMGKEIRFRLLLSEEAASK